MANNIRASIFSSSNFSHILSHTHMHEDSWSPKTLVPKQEYYILNTLNLVWGQGKHGAVLIPWIWIIPSTSWLALTSRASLECIKFFKITDAWDKTWGRDWQFFLSMVVWAIIGTIFLPFPDGSMSWDWGEVFNSYNKAIHFKDSKERER